MEIQHIFLVITLMICTICMTSAKKNVIELNEENWTRMLDNEWMIKFYAPWCPACKGLQPKWQEFGEWSKDLGINVGQVDVTTSPGLSGRFMVTALPTIFHVLNGEFRQYRGTRDKESFIVFIEEKKWQSLEPIPSWKSPNSIQMSVVSSFFKLSQILRAIHTQLMEDFGLPTWGSYLIFALATIMLGAILGLILVCVIDLIYPPRATSKKAAGKQLQSKKVEKESAGDDYDEEPGLADEDIKADLIDDANQSDNNKSSNPSSPNVRKRKARKD